MAKNKPLSLKIQVSSGGVLIKKEGNEIKVAIIKPKGSNILTLPKGLVEKDEDPETTAIREVAEETGFEGRILKKIGDVSYWFHIKEENARCKKTVNFYLMEYTGQTPHGHDWEVEEVLWLPIDEAIKRANYKTDREILRKAKELIGS